MTALALSALAWVLLHVVVAGPLRPGLVRRLGVAAYRGVFSLLSALSLAALIWTYGKAPYIEIWGTTSVLALVPILVMPVAFWLLIGSLHPSNPTMAGPDMKPANGTAELPVTGLTKITRHPMLWSFSLWAASHMIANGDVATWLMGGAILITALNGMPSIDRKRAAQFGEQWQRFKDKTSIIPLMAVAQGRVRLRAADIGILNIVVSALVYGVFMYFHAILFGVPVYHP